LSAEFIKLLVTQALVMTLVPVNYKKDVLDYIAGDFSL
jgi:hypothetical protein